MLYQIYETQRALMEPFSELAAAVSKVFANPLNPMRTVPGAQRMAAAYTLLHRLGKNYDKPEFGIRTIDVDGVEVAIHERIEIDKPFCELRRFKRFSDDAATLLKLKDQPVVLLVAPLSGHYATLLRDTVRTMLGGHKVYITDWKDACAVPLSEGTFSLDDYVNYVQDFIRYLQASHGNCHVISVCQPTVPVMAAISLMASRGEQTPLSMVMMGGPLDTRQSPTSVNDLATTKSHAWFENNVIYRVPPNYPGAGRRVYPGFLQHAGFIAMNPNRHASSHYDYFKDLIKGDQSSAATHQQFYDEYNAVLDMDAEYYLDTIKTVFQDQALPNGTWDVRSPRGKKERVRPQDIRHTALLTVEGELDDISGPGQTRAAHTMCTGIAPRMKRDFLVEGAGHYGIFSGRRWRTVVYPVVRQFILDHQSGSGAAQPKAKPTRSAKTTRTSAKVSAKASTAPAPAPAAKRAATGAARSRVKASPPAALPSPAAPAQAVERAPRGSKRA